MEINKTLENLRINYQSAALDIHDCDQDPLLQFDKWLKEALLSECDEPNAFILSTVRDQRPRARVILLKGIHHNEFIFYTNYNSAKGDELNDNSKVAMTFMWLPLQRQVRIEGTVTKVSEELSDDYFQKRPRGSQLGAIASPQSKIVANREALEKMFSETETKFKNVEILPRPSHWGGYGVTPTLIEFWQGRNNRMHDRICYVKNGESWELQRLAP